MIKDKLFLYNYLEKRENEIIIRFDLNKRKHSKNENEKFRINIDEKFQINIPSTGDITSLGAKQLIEALKIAIKINDKELSI